MNDGYRCAIVRPPGDSFRLAVSLHPDRGLIDPNRARAQHEVYRRTLVAMGLELIVLPPDERHPDSCFTQDPALVLEGRGLVGRPGIESRRGEVAKIEDALTSLLTTVEAVRGPATLEGGDVLRLGRKLIVGRSKRTNGAGIEALVRFAGPLGFEVAQADVPHGFLHLLTAVTALSEDLVIGWEEVLEQPAFRGLEKIPIREGPIEACNVLAVGHEVITSGNFPTNGELEHRGFTVHQLDLQEFVRADGGPTCLALLVDHVPAKSQNDLGV